MLRKAAVIAAMWSIATTTAMGDLLGPNPKMIFDRLNRGLQGFRGQPISQAISVLGYPDSQSEIAGDTVYVWHRSGFIGGSNAQPLERTVKLATRSGAVLTSEFNGNAGPCKEYSDLFPK